MHDGELTTKVGRFELSKKHVGFELKIWIKLGKTILMVASVGRLVVMVKENSMVMGLDTPVIADERAGEVRTLGLGVSVSIPEAIRKEFLLI